VWTSQSSARAVLAGSVCHPDLDTDCHVPFGCAPGRLRTPRNDSCSLYTVFANTISSDNMTALMGNLHLKTVNNVRGSYI
ncbi:MAG: hypothetical protein J4N63_08855, partial [Chloroflexi bacterium]|nr:hypothetical protein [Chloroflexota bacterium]